MLDAILQYTVPASSVTPVTVTVVADACAPATLESTGAAVSDAVHSHTSASRDVLLPEFMSC